MSTQQITGSNGIVQYAPEDEPNKYQCAHCGELFYKNSIVEFRDTTSGDMIISCLDCYDDYYAFYQCPEQS